uniref:Methionine gamma-lyase n=1 Tax=Ananas comosus var. bracteatus TaxID=296719 RepID=A0A6V7NHE5_ANACO|nr:unnamed protein product [Ananas comosus var. bracteatus]
MVVVVTCNGRGDDDGGGEEVVVTCGGKEEVVEVVTCSGKEVVVVVIYTYKEEEVEVVTCNSRVEVDVEEVVVIYTYKEEEEVVVVIYNGRVEVDGKEVVVMTHGSEEEVVVEQHPSCRSTSPAAAAAEEAAAATRHMSAAAAPAAIARARFSFARHSANSPRTVLNLGRLMAALEGTEAAYCTASGMSAIAAVLLQLVGAGGHVVASKCLYGGTHTLLSRFLPCACGIRATFVNADDTHAVRAAVHEGTPRSSIFIIYIYI